MRKNSYVNLGLLYYEQHNYNHAEIYLRKTIELGEIDLFDKYAYTLQKIDKKEEALKYLQYHLMLKNANIYEKKIFYNLIKK